MPRSPAGTITAPSTSPTCARGACTRAPARATSRSAGTTPGSTLLRGAHPALGARLRAARACGGGRAAPARTSCTTTSPVRSATPACATAGVLLHPCSRAPEDGEWIRWTRACDWRRTRGSAAAGAARRSRSSIRAAPRRACRRVCGAARVLGALAAVAVPARARRCGAGGKARRGGRGGGRARRSPQSDRARELGAAGVSDLPSSVSPWGGTHGSAGRRPPSLRVAGRGKLATSPASWPLLTTDDGRRHRSRRTTTVEHRLRMQRPHARCASTCSWRRGSVIQILPLDGETQPSSCARRPGRRSRGSPGSRRDPWVLLPAVHRGRSRSSSRAPGGARAPGTAGCRR